MNLFFDIEKIINDILPPSLRKQNVVELLNAWLIKTKNANIDFNKYQREITREYLYTPEVIRVEHSLNTNVELTGGTVRILDGDDLLEEYIYNEDEYNTEQLYTYNESESITPEFYSYNYGENSSFDFYVEVPIAYSGTTIVNNIEKIIVKDTPVGFSHGYLFV